MIPEHKLFKCLFSLFFEKETGPARLCVDRRSFLYLIGFNTQSGRSFKQQNCIIDTNTMQWLIFSSSLCSIIACSIHNSNISKWDVHYCEFQIAQCWSPVSKGPYNLSQAIISISPFFFAFQSGLLPSKRAEHNGSMSTCFTD